MLIRSDVFIYINISINDLDHTHNDLDKQIMDIMHKKIKEIVKYDFKKLVIYHSMGFCKEIFKPDDIREIVGTDLPICRIKNKKGAFL